MQKASLSALAVIKFQDATKGAAAAAAFIPSGSKGTTFFWSNPKSRMFEKKKKKRRFETELKRRSFHVERGTGIATEPIGKMTALKG